MRLNVIAAVSLLLASVSAHAGVFQIEIESGTDDITFDVPSSPVSPQQTGTGGFELDGLTFIVNGKSMSGAAAFYPFGTPFPGIEAQVGFDFFATEGIQVFTGSTSSPTFSLATFTSTSTSGLAGSTATVRITDVTPAAPAPSSVPEPSIVALLGIGIAGFVALKRRRSA